VPEEHTGRSHVRLAGTARAEKGTAATVCSASPWLSASSTAFVISSINSGMPTRESGAASRSSRSIGGPTFIAIDQIDSIVAASNHTTVRPNGAGGPVLTFAGDSDAHIVRGLIAILFAIYSGKNAREILNTDAVKLFEGMGLREHLTPQRSNGFRSMVERIRSDARAALAVAA
jgi:Fe-S metabolism associated protein SufE